MCVAVLLFLGASRLGVWESLLVSLGRWLVVETPLRKADLIVALGGGRERQRTAVQLLQQGLARQVLFTGADVQPDDYQCLGVPVGQAMALPVLAYTTYEEAVAIRQIVQVHGLDSVLIVTSSYHTRRAYWLFEWVFRGTGAELFMFLREQEKADRISIFARAVPYPTTASTTTLSHGLLRSASVQLDFIHHAHSAQQKRGLPARQIKSSSLGSRRNQT